MRQRGLFSGSNDTKLRQKNRKEVKKEAWCGDLSGRTARAKL